MLFDIKSKEITRKLHSHPMIYTEDTTVVLCSRCNGIGSYNIEELVCYHKGEYETIMYTCEKCEGDGRLVKTTRQLKFNDIIEEEFKPYITSNTKNSSKSDYIYVKIDCRSSFYEEKYPELKKLTYENYDKRLKEIIIQEKLENYNDKKG